MDGLLISANAGEKMVPNLDLCQKVYEYETIIGAGDNAEAFDLQSNILKIIVDDSMTNYYSHLCEKFKWNVDDIILSEMRAKNSEELEAIEKSYTDAVENAGDMEILDALFAKARLFARIGNYEAAYKAYDEILTRGKTSSGKKIDATLEKARVAFFAMDVPLLRELLASAKLLIDAGGDWDRRNRLKVYEALYLLVTREMRKAADLLTECIATFTCVEMCSYEDFMFYTILTSAFSLPRDELRKKIIQNPQVISVTRESPKLEKFLTSLYQCDYKDFFASVVDLFPSIQRNRYLGKHIVFLIREYRVTAYFQFLQAYRSVTLSTMAGAFGLSTAMLDQELSRFISIGRLNAKIDKVGDIIVTSQPDKKNTQYQEVIKKGDVLLNQIQKLARALQI